MPTLVCFTKAAGLLALGYKQTFGKTGPSATRPRYSCLFNSACARLRTNSACARFCFLHTKHQSTKPADVLSLPALPRPLPMVAVVRHLSVQHRVLEVPEGALQPLGEDLLQSGNWRIHKHARAVSGAEWACAQIFNRG